MTPQRLDIDYRIAWQGRWHVGSGYRSAVANRLQQRCRAPRENPRSSTKRCTSAVADRSQQRCRGGDGAPFVPGSHVKGVLRHQCERLAVALGVETVDPHAGADEGDRSLVAHFQPLAKSRLLIDRLFGSRYQGECMFVTDAVPSAQRPLRGTTVAARTAIDRVTGTVMEQHLFTTEIVEAGIDLRGTIRARHPGGVLTQDDDGFPYEYALLVAGLLSLETLGGDKSVGLGRCEVSIEQDALRRNGKCVAPAKALRSFEECEWAVMIKILRGEI